MGEICDTEEPRITLLRLVIISLSAVFLIFMSVLALPWDIAVSVWLDALLFSALFLIMALFIFTGQLFIKNRRSFRLVMTNMFIVLSLIFVICSVFLFFSLSLTNENYLAYSFMIAIIIVFFWDTASIAKKWVSNGNNLQDLFSELELLSHVLMYTLYMAGVLLAIITLFICMQEYLFSSVISLQIAAIFSAFIPYMLADLEIAKAYKIAEKKVSPVVLQRGYNPHVVVAHSFLKIF